MTSIITVIGATGIQGGSVIAALEKEGNFKIRAITRNVDSPRAKSLAARGIELAVADLNDEESLVKAFEGTYAVYAVTDFFEPFQKFGPKRAAEIELAQGLNLAKAASKTPTLKHYIWSTLADGEALSSGEFVIPHFDSKNKIDKYIKSDATLLAKTTFLWNTYYTSNFTFPVFAPDFLKSSGKYVFIQPTPPTTIITALGDQNHNVGVFVSAILKQPHLTLPGKFVLASSETTTNGELIKTWSKATGKDVEYLQVTLEEYSRLYPGWGLEMGSMMKMWEKLGDKSWASENALTKEDLGIKEGLVGLEATFASMDWSFL